jgi:protein-arginine deiminase
MRLRLVPVFVLPLAGVGACFDPTLVGEAGGEGAPDAVLTLSVSAGQAPLDVVLDASASTPFEQGGELQFDFDFDGDGTFEVERSDDASVSHRYGDGGAFTALVRVRGEDGRYDVAEADLDVADKNAPRTADVDVDSDHDGVVTGADEAVEDDERAGFFGNVDDDDGDGARDRDDEVLDDVDDDTFPVIVRQARGLGSARVFIAVTPTLAAQRTRLWRDGDIVVDGSTSRAEVDGAGDGDVEFRLEAITGRTGDWDGVVTVTVTVEDGGDVVSSDVVQLRAAPVIFPDNLQAPRRLFVMDIPDGIDNNRALMAALRQGLPDDVDLYTLDENAYSYDRWVQDSWEVGTQLLADGDGGTREMITAMQTERYYGGEGLDAFVPGEWIGADRGFYYPSGDESSHNYGGNLETTPPTTQDPFGRMIYGGGTTTLSGARSVDTMNEDQVSFLDAQEVQAPAVEVSSEWLAVGHVDEIFQFVPDLSPDEGGKAFKVVIASPSFARDVLSSLQAGGHGDDVVFAGRRNSASVDEILGDEDFMALNELAQARIDGVQAHMKTALGLVDDDFRPVPVLFEEVDGSGLVAAYNPGIQNLVTVGDRVFAPDPEGPVEGGADAWQQATLTSLADTDLDVIFVDVFESYHELLGEAHCGTNLERAPYSTPWWTVKE